MALDLWKSREVPNATDTLEREAAMSPGLDPQTRSRIQNLVTRSRQVNQRTPANVVDQLAREADDLNALFTSGRIGAQPNATIGSMTMDQIQRRTGDLAREQATAAPERRRQILEELRGLKAQRDALSGGGAASGTVEMNLYEWRHTLQDLDHWHQQLKNPNATQVADYNAVRTELQTYIAEAEGRFQRSHLDAARTMLTQAQLTRGQVERELFTTIAQNKNVTERDIGRFANGFGYWSRFATQTIGGALGAAGAGVLAKTYISTVGPASVIAAGGALALAPVIAKTLAVGIGIYAGALAGTALFRYAPRVFSRSRRAARAEEAKARKDAIVGDRGKFEQFENTLRQAVGDNAIRAQQTAALLEAQYGTRGGYVGREIRHIRRRALAGTIVATGGAAGAEIANNWEYYSDIPKNYEDSLRYFLSLGSGTLDQMKYAYDQASVGVQTLWNYIASYKFW